MITVDNKIKNIYYMLCYSFNNEMLSEKGTSKVGAEAFENIYNLFSAMLSEMVQKQVKRGINREYILSEQILSTIRGKILFNETISNNALGTKKFVCQFDDFSENNTLNRIIKTTLQYLIKSNRVNQDIRNELKKSIVYFNNVDTIDIKAIIWKQLNYNKNNKSYRNIIILCNLILKGLIVLNEDGKYEFQEFLSEERLSNIYESFLREYFRKNYSFLNPGSRVLSLVDDDTDLIGKMRTDVTLETKTKMLIIDAKFYRHILFPSRFMGSQIISMANLYQINAYVENQLQNTDKNVKGMLLYAQTIDEPAIDVTYPMNQKEIIIKTLDLNQEWNEIKRTLDDIAKLLIDEDEYYTVSEDDETEYYDMVAENLDDTKYE